MKYANLSLLRLIISTGLLMGYVFSLPARAETIDCTAITTVPYTINSSGIYCLTGNLGTSISSGNAITIAANNVTLDLNGWRLGGLSAGPTTEARGIYAVFRKNITIRNGTIRGFWKAVSLTDNSPYTTSQGHLVEEIRAEQNTYVGIETKGKGIIVRRCQIVDTGHCLSGVLVCQPCAVFQQSHIAGIMQAILNAPIGADHFQQTNWRNLVTR